jgi:hypothetical protein
MKSHTRVLSMLAAACHLAGAGAAAAEDMAEDSWRYQITPYVWASGVSGSLTPFTGGPTVSFDQSFGDILDSLDGAFFIAGLARKDRWVLSGDLTFVNTSNAGTLPGGAPASGKLRQSTLTLLGGYTVVQTPEATVDLMAGLRIFRTEVSVAVPLGGIAASGSKTFYDATLAVRGMFPVADRWSLMFYGDYAGFGSGPEHSWQILGVANWEMRENLFLSGGYRQLNVDYDENGTAVDVKMSGPILGLTWRF